jgi:hypothetical protein
MILFGRLNMDYAQTSGSYHISEVEDFHARMAANSTFTFDRAIHVRTMGKCADTGLIHGKLYHDHYEGMIDVTASFLGLHVESARVLGGVSASRLSSSPTITVQCDEQDFLSAMKVGLSKLAQKDGEVPLKILEARKDLFLDVFLDESSHVFF